MASSPIPAGIPIINDETPWPDPPAGQSRGLDLSERPATEYGYSGVAAAFPSHLLIPESEWQARIKEREERKTRCVDLCDQAGLTVCDQNGTNYCWINAPTHLVEIARVLQNQELIRLSPASAGGPIKGFRNVGGWGKEGLEWIIKYGLVPVSKWPANAISRTYYTEENKALALNYRGLEWMELRPRNLQEQISCLLHGMPCAVGLNYWSHEVTDMDPVWLDGEVAILFDNSWGPGYGTNGRGIRQGRKRLSDDTVCLRSTMAS